MEYAFVQAMITQQDKGNRNNGNFSSEAYTNMVNELKQKLNKDFTKQLFFGTQRFLNFLEAEEEVWEHLIEAKPEAAIWKSKKVSNYDDLLLLFAKDRASGFSAQTAKEKNSKEKKGIENKKAGIKIETIEDIDELLATNEVTYENLVKLDDIQTESPTPFSPEQTSNASKSKSKKRILEEEEDSNAKIMGSVHVVADAIREGNVAYQRDYTGGEIHKELEPLNFEPDVISSALIFLADNPKKARLLFSCPLEMRKNVLKKMLGSSE
ncbi:Myb/SANT-like domain-containing protein [Tanacetum coccineum]